MNSVMNADRHSCSGNALDRRSIGPIALCVLRLVLTIFAAMIVLASLLHGLSTASRQTQAASPVVPSRDVVVSGSTRCRIPALDITKTVDPPDPEVGSVVTISFIITGLNLKTVDVVLVQDVSNSMSGQPLTDSKDAAIEFVKMKQDEDRVGVVAYNDTAWLAQPLTKDKSDIITAINGLTASEYTNIGTGIISGYAELISCTNYVSGTVKAMVLLSDGEANRPQPDSHAKRYARDQAQVAGDCGILIYAVGFGSADEDLMQYVADVTGGEYYSTPTSTELTTIYREIAMELRNIVITDVLQPDVHLDCDLMPDGWGCFEGADGFITVTYTIGNERPIADPLILSFTATVGLTPDPESQMMNTPSSCVYYDGPGNPLGGPNSPDCQYFENPSVCMRPYQTDIYEPDDEYSPEVQAISPGESPQLHNFSHSGDADWVRAQAWPGAIYTFTTGAVSAGVGDRLLELYTGTCSVDLTRLTSDTNILVWPPSSLFQPIALKIDSSMSASELGVTPAIILDEPEYYYLRVSSIDDRFGCGTQYTLSVEHSLDFALNVTPSAQEVFRGQAVSFLIQLVSATPDFAFPVALGVGGVPSGTPFGMVPSEITSGRQATLFITTTEATPLGSHGLVITGTVGAFERSTGATLRVVMTRIFLPIVLRQ